MYADNRKAGCNDEDSLRRTRLRVMETQDVNEAGGLAFQAASKTSKDFSLVTSRFWSSTSLRSISTRMFTQSSFSLTERIYNNSRSSFIVWLKDIFQQYCILQRSNERNLYNYNVYNADS